MIESLVPGTRWSACSLRAASSMRMICCRVTSAGVPIGMTRLAVARSLSTLGRKRKPMMPPTQMPMEIMNTARKTESAT